MKHAKKRILLGAAPMPELKISAVPKPASVKQERVFGQVEVYGDGGKLVQSWDANVTSFKTLGNGDRVFETWNTRKWVLISGGLVIATLAGDELGLQRYLKKDVNYP